MGKYLAAFDIEREIRIPGKVLFKDAYEEHLKRFAMVSAVLSPELVKTTLELLESYAGHDELAREEKAS